MNTSNIELEKNPMLVEYAGLIVQIDALESRRKELADAVCKTLKDEKMEKVLTQFGTFSIVKSVKYLYSEKVKSLEDGVSMLKDAEKTNGTAKKEEKESLRFQSVRSPIKIVN